MIRASFLCFILFGLSAGIFAQVLPADKNASLETKNLYQNLVKISKSGTMIGHQDDLAYGVNWAYEDGRSDIKDVVGDYPAVFGWDLGYLELKKDKNLDEVPFNKMKEFARQVYQKGGVNTYSWHLNNPVNPEKTSWDLPDSTIYFILNDPEVKETYLSWLDEVAAFMLDLKGPQGEAIPVIFRPLHEQNGSWFWWGKKFSTPEEYKQLYRLTVDYLRNTKKVNNLLYGYSPDKFYSKEEFLERYPGDEYVDLIGFDVYHRPNPQDTVDTFVADTKKMVDMLKSIGEERNKLTAITETGLEQIPIENWWTETMLPIITGSNLSYVLMWRNGRPDHYYAPYPGQVSANDFQKFYNHPKTIFLSQLAEKNLYGKKTKNRKRSSKN